MLFDKVENMKNLNVIFEEELLYMAIFYLRSNKIKGVKPQGKP